MKIMIKKKLEIKKSKYPDKDGKYILWGYVESNHGNCYKRLFKGSRSDCMRKRDSYV